MSVNGERVRQAFLGSGQAAVALLRSEEIVAAWDRPSVLAHWRVSGLTGHLCRAVLTVPRYLDEELSASSGPTGDAAGYLLQAVDDESLEVDSELAMAIRARGDEQAGHGPAVLAGNVQQALELLRPLLGRSQARIRGDRPMHVLDGIEIALDDYLATRVVELVVHLDDLAASIGRPIELPRAAMEVATDVLVELARRRRGDLAIMRSLARRERAPVGPLAL